MELYSPISSFHFVHNTANKRVEKIVEEEEDIIRKIKIENVRNRMNKKKKKRDICLERKAKG